MLSLAYYSIEKSMVSLSRLVDFAKFNNGMNIHI